MELAAGKEFDQPCSKPDFLLTLHHTPFFTPLSQTRPIKDTGRAIQKAFPMLRSIKIRTAIRGNSDTLLSKLGGLYSIKIPPEAKEILLEQNLHSGSCFMPMFDSPVCQQEFRRHTLLLMSPCPAISLVLPSSHLKEENICSPRFLLLSLAVLHLEPITFWQQIAN